MAERIQHGAFLLIERKGSEGAAVHKHRLGNAAVVSYGLFLPIEVDHGVSGRLGARSGSGGDSKQPDRVGNRLLEQVALALVHAAEELDAFGHVHGAAAAHRYDAVAAVPVKQLHTLHHRFIEGIWLKVAEPRDPDVPPCLQTLKIPAYGQEPYGTAAYEHDRPDSVLCQIGVKLPIILRGVYNVLQGYLPQSCSGISRMISANGMSMSSHSLALWCSSIMWAAFWIAGTVALMSWLA